MEPSAVAAVSPKSCASLSSVDVEDRFGEERGGLLGSDP